jgi:hypothetical protein
MKTLRRQVFGSMVGLAALLLLGTVALGQGFSSTNSGQPADPVSVTPALAHQITVTPEIKKAFAHGEGIEIKKVTGTTTGFEVGGTYQITGVCRQRSLENATLYIGNTADIGPDAIVPVAGTSLYEPLPEGSKEFSFTFKLLRPGVLHMTIYDLDNRSRDDNSYAGIYLGSVYI